MTIETRTATEFAETAQRVESGELQLRSLSVGRRNGWYVFELIDPPEPEPTTPNEALKRLLK